MDPTSNVTTVSSNKFKNNNSQLSMFSSIERIIDDPSLLQCQLYIHQTNLRCQYRTLD